jgi:hypothetical protein
MMPLVGQKEKGPNLELGCMEVNRESATYFSSQRVLDLALVILSSFLRFQKKYKGGSHREAILKRVWP